MNNQVETTKERGKRVRKNILEFVIGYIQEHGYSPTVREISDGVDLKSTATVHGHLFKMFGNGELETDAEIGTARAIRVPGWKFVKEEGENK